MQNKNFILKIKERLKNTNKGVLAGVIVVILSGILVGGILKLRKSNVNDIPTPAGLVQGDLTQVSPTDVPTDSPTPTDQPTDTPIDQATDVPVDNSSEGANPTDAPTATSTPVPTSTPTATPTVTPTPTPAPDSYSASISNVNNSPATADGVSAINITINVTKNGNVDCGESVSLIADKVSFVSNNDCSSGNITFKATSTTAGTYTVTAQVYGQSYGTSTIVFN